MHTRAPTMIRHPLTRVQTDIRDLFQDGLSDSAKEELAAKYPCLLYGRPINRNTTGYFYPAKMDAHTFISESKGAAVHFQNYTKHAEKTGDYHGLLTEKYPEEWAETFLKHMEIEHEKERAATSNKPL